MSRILLGLLSNAHLLQEQHGVFPGGWRRLPLHPHWSQGDVLQDGEVGKQVELLEHHPHPFTNALDLPGICFGVEAKPQHIKMA